MEEHTRADQVFMTTTLAAGIGTGIAFLTFPDVERLVLVATAALALFALVVHVGFR